MLTISLAAAGCLAIRSNLAVSMCLLKMDGLSGLAFVVGPVAQRHAHP